jgi:putative transposase
MTADQVSPARRAINEMIEAGLLDDVMSKVDADGLALTGEGGFLPEWSRRCWRGGCRPS